LEDKKILALLMAKFFTLLLLLTACTAVPLQAATVLVDFGPTATTGQPQTWNHFSGTADNYGLVGLRTTTGATTTYNLTLTGGGVMHPGTESQGTGFSPPAPFTPTTVYNDFIFMNEDRTLVLSGLDPLLTYNIDLYAYLNRDSARTTRFTINGTSLIIEPSSINSPTYSGQIASFSNLVPDDSGNLSIALSSTVKSNWILSAMQITSVPEPSRALLLTAGLLMLGLRRQRA
jgi:hypothetical protein